MDLLAQQTPPSLPELPPWQEWWHYGPLGIGAMLVCASVVLALAGVGAYVWLVWLPDRRETKRIERARREREGNLELTSKEKAIALSDTLREVLPAFADTQKRLVTQIEVMHDRQEPHAEACKRTVEKVEKLSERVEQIAGSLKLGNT